MRGRPTDRGGRWGRLRLLTRLALGVGRGRQRLSGPRRGEAMRDRGRLQPVRCAELAQDVRDMHAGRPDADDECRRDLAVGVAAHEEGQDLRLPRRQAEDLLQALLPVGRPDVRRRGLQPCALGEQLKLFCQGCRSDPGRDGVRLPLPATVAEAGTRATLPKSRWLVGGRWRTRAAGLGAGRGGRACPLSDQAGQAGVRSARRGRRRGGRGSRRQREVAAAAAWLPSSAGGAITVGGRRRA
jgi:hypothetical protein